MKNLKIYDVMPTINISHMDDHLSQVITIDGVVGSGKSSVGFAFAQRIGYQFVDSGIFYRAITYSILCKNLDILDDINNENIALNLNIDFVTQEEDVVILLDNVDVTHNIHLDNVNLNVSKVSSQQKVRDAVTKLQKQFASKKKTAVAGQDIGTHVFPESKLKFFIEVPIEERALRRYNQFVKKGVQITYEETLNNITLREIADKTRIYHPLTIPKDAHIIHNYGRTLLKSVDEMVEIYKTVFNA